MTWRCKLAPAFKSLDTGTFCHNVPRHCSQNSTHTRKPPIRDSECQRQSCCQLASHVRWLTTRYQAETKKQESNGYEMDGLENIAKLSWLLLQSLLDVLITHFTTYYLLYDTLRRSSTGQSNILWSYCSDDTFWFSTGRSQSCLLRGGF